MLRQYRRNSSSAKHPSWHSALASAAQLLTTSTQRARQKASFIRIDGSTDPSKRSELVKQFQYSEDVRGAILSIKAAGVGLTLTVSRQLARLPL